MDKTAPRESIDVLVIGGGPVGSALALDLAWRGVSVLLAERDAIVQNDVRARGLNARTMEHFRRLGIADEIRRRDELPPAFYDATVVTMAIAAEPIAILPRDPDEVSVPGTASRLPEEVAELPHILPQPRIVEVLRERFGDLGGHLAAGWEVISLSQSADAVHAELREVATGRRRRVAARYAVGADGARSLVRDVSGIQLETTRPLGKRLSVTFRFADMFERTGAPRYARFLLPRGDGFDLLTTHAPDQWGFGIGPFSLDEDLSRIDLIAEARRLIGADVPIEIDSARTWPVQRSVATRYRAGRLFIAGDAAHTCPPTGGQNMNTGIGDAMNLSWKLAATINGWGGPGLLDSYDQERRPVGIRNTDWSLENTSLTRQPAANGAVDENRVARRGFASLGGIVLDLRYESSIVARDDAAAPEWRPNNFAGIAKAGHRAPHFRLSDGGSFYDRLGDGHTLVAFGDGGGLDDVKRAADARALPLDVLRLDSPRARSIYGARLAIVRPDQQIAWRGDAPPADPGALIEMLRGGETAGRQLVS